MVNLQCIKQCCVPFKHKEIQNKKIVYEFKQFSWVFLHFTSKNNVKKIILNLLKVKKLGKILFKMSS